MDTRRVYFNGGAESAIDLDGNGKFMPGTDQMGYLAKHAANRAFWTSTGNTLVSRENDTITIKPLDEQMTQVYDKMRAFLTDRNLVYVDREADIGVLAQPFANGLYLFMDSVIGTAETMRESEVDFGIVPLPKKDEAQEAYYSQIATSTSAFYLPVNLPDREMIGKVCETLSYYSHKDLVSAYYETALKSKYTRAPEDQLMLDYIRDSASTDFAFAYSNLFNNETNDIINWAWEDKDLASTYASKIKVWNKILQTLLNAKLPD